MSNHVQSCVPSNNVRKHKTLLRRVAKTVRQKSGRLSVTPLAFNHNRFTLQILILSIVALCAHSMEISVKDRVKQHLEKADEAKKTNVSHHVPRKQVIHGMAMRSGNKEKMDITNLQITANACNKAIAAAVRKGDFDLAAKLTIKNQKRTQQRAKMEQDRLKDEGKPFLLAGTREKYDNLVAQIENQRKRLKDNKIRRHLRQQARKDLEAMEKNRIGLLKSWGSQLAEADAPQGSTPSGGFSLAEANAAYKTAEEHKKRYIFCRDDRRLAAAPNSYSQLCGAAILFVGMIAGFILGKITKCRKQRRMSREF